MRDSPESSDINKKPFLRQREANELIAPIKDLTTSQLLALASVQIFMSASKSASWPGRIDLLFFNQVMLKVFSQHDLLRKILQCPGDQNK
jgi:hypothetical protein